MLRRKSSKIVNIDVEGKKIKHIKEVNTRKDKRKVFYI